MSREPLNGAELDQRLAALLATLRVSGRRVLLIVPDATRTMPMAQVFAAVRGSLLPRAAALDVLIALGTHQPMGDEALTRHLGVPVVDGQAGTTRVFNHRWDDPATFVTLGTIPGDDIAALTGGRFHRAVPVSLNRLVLEYDHLLVCGPVFPHEVAGFSGGTKYLFPGIAGADIIDFTHWLGAVITSAAVIGVRDTPVRAVIDRAARAVPTPFSCLCFVTTHDGVIDVFGDEPRAAWEAAAALSAQVHIRRVPRPFRRALAVMPEMYADLWTAAKGMYKLEPVMADGGELVIYAPHITDVSYSHGPVIDEVGYHCRDYFLAQPERFAGYPGGVLAHSTHVKGLGTYDAATGVERPRVTVTLATGIPRERCDRINLGYTDPSSIRIADWRGREAEGVLLVDRAGETLYRLTDASH